MKIRFIAADILLTLFVIILAGGIYAAHLRSSLGGADTVTVTVDGMPVGTLSFTKDGEYPYLDGAFVLSVKDGVVSVETTSCPDKICQSMHITSAGGSIVCLPNRVAVTITKESSTNAPDFTAG